MQDLKPRPNKGHRSNAAPSANRQTLYCPTCGASCRQYATSCDGTSEYAHECPTHGYVDRPTSIQPGARGERA